MLLCYWPGEELTTPLDVLPILKMLEKPYSQHIT